MESTGDKDQLCELDDGILLTVYVTTENRDVTLARLETCLTGKSKIRYVVVDVSRFPEVAKIEELIMTPTIVRWERRDGELVKSIMIGKLTDRKVVLEFLNWGPELSFSGF